MLQRSIIGAVLSVTVLSACAPGISGNGRQSPTPADRTVEPFPAEAERVARSLGVRWEVPEVSMEAGSAEGDESVGAGGMAVVSWDIPVRNWEDNDRVGHYVRLFGGTGVKSFAARLERGSVYEPMIRSVFREQGVPEDLYYLALVESGFEPHAYSRAAAVGIWQFMSATAKGYGLRMDWWMDERRDPVASTYAAARFLRDLRTQFGSDFLAAAAYNGGPTRIRRGLTRHASDLGDANGDDAFFALTETGFLPRETQNYVPQLIAAALVAKEPDRYGFTVTPRPALAYDSVMVAGGSSLPAIAAAANVDATDVLSLNPHYLRASTPIGSAEWLVRIPAGTREVFEERWAALNRDDQRAYTVYRASAGESLHDVARKSGMSTRELAAFNPDVRSGNGKLVEQNLRVPVAAVRSVMVVTPDPQLDRLIALHTPARTYTVKRGDTLDGISRRHGVTVRQLQRWNSMEGRTLIKVGQRLVVTGSA